jgi:hypothetical protein
VSVSSKPVPSSFKTSSGGRSSRPSAMSGRRSCRYDPIRAPRTDLVCRRTGHKASAAIRLTGNKGNGTEATHWPISALDRWISEQSLRRWRDRVGIGNERGKDVYRAATRSFVQRSVIRRPRHHADMSASSGCATSRISTRPRNAGIRPMRDCRAVLAAGSGTDRKRTVWPLNHSHARRGAGCRFPS